MAEQYYPSEAHTASEGESPATNAVGMCANSQEADTNQFDA